MAGFLSKAFGYWSSESKSPTSSGTKKSINELVEGEVIFSKNNICVHINEGQHIPGYFTIKVHKFFPFSEDGDDSHEEATLILTWVPNGIIEKHPKSISSTPIPGSPTKTIQSVDSNDDVFVSSPSVVSRQQSIDTFLSKAQTTPVDSDEVTAILNSIIIRNHQKSTSHIKEGGSSVSRVDQNGSSHHKLTQSVKPISEESRRRPSDHSESSRCSETSPSPKVEIFTVDLRQMKSLRLFFTSTESCLKEAENNSTGQLVIASRESQFKVFHFHFGGLDRLVSVLEEWNFLKKKSKMRSRTESTASSSQSGNKTNGSLSNSRKTSTSSTSSDFGSRIKGFTVWRPPTSLRKDECHLEEGIYSELDPETFSRSIINSDGQIEDEFKLRRIVFFGGIHPKLREQVWPFLLQRFPCESTYIERAMMIENGHLKYQEIDHKRLNMSPEEQDDFWKRIQCTVEKDVPRTDRCNPFFAGDQNENMLIMKRILLNYAVHNPKIGYTQGMSDLLAPLMIEMKTESEVFWCFEGLMEKTFFVSSPKDIDMDSNLSLLRELIRIMFPAFYYHLTKLPDGLELLFTHRWILLCFKREFPESASIKIWESSWARYQTDHFHLFVALAITCIYGQDVIDQEMKDDEILFHFSTLTMHMDGDLVLKKARGLLYQFRLLNKIPCTLKKLCFYSPSLSSPSLSSSSVLPDSWDSRFVPAVECIRDGPDQLVTEYCQCFPRKPSDPSS